MIEGQIRETTTTRRRPPPPPLAPRRDEHAHGHDDPDRGSQHRQSQGGVTMQDNSQFFDRPRAGRDARANASPWASGPGPHLVYGISIDRRLGSRPLFTSQSIAADASG